MIKKISAMDARKQLGQIMNEVSLRMDQYIIERGGKPLVAIIPIKQFQQWVEKRKEFFQAVDEIRNINKGASAQEIERDVATAVKKVRGGQGKRKG